MALLTDADRREVWAALMRDALGSVAATKPQLRAAVDAADGWADGQLAGFTGAIPAPVRSPGPAHTLLANAAAIARGASIADVSAGVASRDQSAVLLAAYNAASAWLTDHAASYLTATLTACGGTLTQPQTLAVLESVCRRRAL